MLGQNAYMGACECGGLIEADPHIAYSVETGIEGATTSAFYCTARCKLTALQFDSSDREPFSQRELNDLANYRQQPITCDHCGDIIGTYGGTK